MAKSNQHSLTLRKYLEIIDLKPDNFDTQIDYKIEVVSIYLDKDSEEVESYQYSEINSVYDSILLPENINNKESKKILRINKRDLKLIPFNNLTLGEWIDLEHYITKPDTILETLAVLYRVYKAGNDFELDEFEEYGNWIEHRKNLFLDVNVEDIWNVRTEYINFRNEVLQRYSGLFEQEVEEEEDLEGLSPAQIAEYNRLKALEETQKSFNWEYIIMALAGDDASKFEQILKMPMILVFNLLSALKLKTKNTK